MLSPRWPIPTRRRRAAPVRAHSPGRVNLIGDHTDYNEGLALPMAVDLGTTVTFVPDEGTAVVLRSVARARARRRRRAHAPSTPGALEAVEPPLGPLRRRRRGGRPSLPAAGAARSTRTLPVGAGLSSSAALEVALALVFGCDAEPADLGAHLPARRAGRHGGARPGSWTNSW